MLRSLLMACVLVIVPLQGHANPTAETEEMDSWTWWMTRETC